MIGDKEAQRITQISAHTLRYYERIGLLRVTRAENGHRRYSEADLGWVRFVMLLRGTNMPLPDIATFMKLEKDGQSTLDKRRHLLECHRHELAQHIETLQGYMRALDAKIDYYRHTSADVCDCVSSREEPDHEVSSTGTNGHQSQPVVSGKHVVRKRHR